MIGGRRGGKYLLKLVECRWRNGDKTDKSKAVRNFKWGTFWSQGWQRTKESLKW